MDNLPSRQAPSPTMRTTLVDNILLLKILSDCAAACAGRGIPLLAIKGIAFLGREYPDLSQRRMTDIDLLVRRSDFGPAERILLDLGWARARDNNALHQDSYERLFHVTAGGFRVAIDLHHAVAHPQAFPIEYERVFAEAEGHPLEDLQRTGVRRPSPGHSLLILALHQLYDAFPVDDRNFHDAQRVLERNRVDPRRLAGDADRWGARSVLHFFLARGGALGIIRDPGSLIAELPVSRLRRGAMRIVLDPARPDPFRVRLRSKRARQVVLFYLFCHRLRAAVGFPLHIVRLQAAGWLRRLARTTD
jgi:hypothetical protein